MRGTGWRRGWGWGCGRGRGVWAIGLVLLVALVILAGCAGGGASASVAHPRPAAASATAASAPATIPPAVYTAETRADVAYGPLNGETLDLCLPGGAATARPGVLLIHGGGWQGGDKSQYEDLCRRLAERGFVAATMNYRLAPAHRWPAQLVDAQLAVRWLRSQARDLNLDPARLAAYGDSAGAHLALFLGSLATNHLGDEASLYAGQSPKVNCVVDAFGPVDLTLSGVDPIQRGIVQTFIGAALDADPAAYRDASPLFVVSPRSAPTLIVQGMRDTLVPPSQSQALQQALQQAGVPVRYIAYDGDHAFAGLSQQQRAAIALQAGAFLAAQERP